MLVGSCCSPNLALLLALSTGDRNVLALQMLQNHILCVCVYIYSVVTHCSQEEAFVLAEKGAGQGRSVSLLLQQNQLWGTLWLLEAREE